MHIASMVMIDMVDVIEDEDRCVSIMIPRSRARLSDVPLDFVQIRAAPSIYPALRKCSGAAIFAAESVVCNREMRNWLRSRPGIPRGVAMDSSRRFRGCSTRRRPIRGIIVFGTTPSFVVRPSPRSGDLVTVQGSGL